MIKTNVEKEKVQKTRVTWLQRKKTKVKTQLNVNVLLTFSVPDLPKPFPFLFYSV